MANWQGLIKEYSELLPVTGETPKLTLHEGDTPLIRLDTLSEKYGADLYAKVEGVNPTGSFKDRGMVMAVAKASHSGRLSSASALAPAVQSEGGRSAFRRCRECYSPQHD